MKNKMSPYNITGSGSTAGTVVYVTVLYTGNDWTIVPFPAGSDTTGWSSRQQLAPRDPEHVRVIVEVLYLQDEKFKTKLSTGKRSVKETFWKHLGKDYNWKTRIMHGHNMFVHFASCSGSQKFHVIMKDMNQS